MKQNGDLTLNDHMTLKMLECSFSSILLLAQWLESIVFSGLSAKYFWYAEQPAK